MTPTERVQAEALLAKADVEFRPALGAREDLVAVWATLDRWRRAVEGGFLYHDMLHDPVARMGGLVDQLQAHMPATSACSAQGRP